MKKLFAQLWQWILKYKKKLVYGALALLIGQFCFFNLWWIGLNNVVYADEPENSTQNESFKDKASSWLEDLSFLNRWCYILLYPILILAGALVNNSLVYAEVFSFDTVLWQLWHIVRNFANYALWFIFVFKIFQFLTTGQKSSDMSKLLKSTLIAWIWIQASWFLLAVLIDISNILTYSVWWLPIHILGSWEQSDDPDFWNPYVFQTVVSVDFDDPDTFYLYLSSTSSGSNESTINNIISECETFSFEYGNKREDLIVAPKIIYYCEGEKCYPTQQLICHVWDDVFYLNGFVDGIKWETCSKKDDCKDAQYAYTNSLKWAINKLKAKDQAWIKGDIGDWKVLQVRNAHLTWDDIWVHYWDNVKYWLDVDNKQSWSKWNMKKLHDVLGWDDGYVWVFSALYSSLLGAGDVFRVSDTSLYVSLLNTMLSFCHTLAVGIPLLAMLIVFFMRVGVIWMAIILSPAIILMEAFGWKKKMEEMGSLKYLTLSNLIGIIFSPAVICFAVSISTVLVRIISTVNAEHVMTEKTSILWWLIELNLAWLWVDLWKLICSVIWVAISWFLIWSAVKASALWESKIIKWLQDLAWSALWSVPIIPIPKKGGWVEYVWASTVFGWNDQDGIFSRFSKNLRSKYDEENNEAVNDWFKSSKEKQKDSESKQLAAYTRELTRWSIDGNWMTMQMMIWENNTPKAFRDFHGSDQKSIIEAINNMGKDKLSGIPDGHEITLDSGETYKFVYRKSGASGTTPEEVYKYEKQWS